MLLDAPTTNLSLKSGKLNVDDPFPAPCVVPTIAYRAAYVVLLTADPSHKKYPEGRELALPDQETICPTGAPAPPSPF